MVTVTRFDEGQFQQGAVSGIRAEVAGFKHVVPGVVQPFCQTGSDAAVNQEPHCATTEIADRLSPAITVCA